MISFGFSAFLKLLSLNETPCRAEIRKRVTRLGNSGGYDYHKSFRDHARRYIIKGDEIADLLLSAEKIINPSERQSALKALQRMELWRAEQPGEAIIVPPIVFQSPRKLFRVRFQADFGIIIGGKMTAIHLWNTMKPTLASGPTYAAMTLVAQALEGSDSAPEDIGVLSMREPPRLYKLSDMPDQSALAASVVDWVEEVIRGFSPTPLPSERHPAL